MRPHAVLVGAALEVGAQLLLLRIELRPVVVGLEGVAVEVIGDVNAAAGVGVLEPGAADAVVLLDHRVGDARLLQPDGGEQTRHTGADDQDAKVARRRGTGRGLQRRGARVAAVERHLLHHHRHVLVRHRLADQEAHHAMDGVGIWRRRQRTAAIAIVGERRRGAAPDLRLLLVGHRSLHVAQHRLARPDRAVEDGSVAGQMDQRHHQRRHTGAGDDAIQKRIVLGDERVDSGNWFGHRRSTRRAESCPRRWEEQHSPSR